MGSFENDVCAVEFGISVLPYLTVLSFPFTGNTGAAVWTTEICARTAVFSGHGVQYAQSQQTGALWVFRLGVRML